MLFNPFILSAIMIVWFNLTYRLSERIHDRSAVARALEWVSLPVGVFVCLSCLVIPFVFLNALGITLALIVCLVARASARTFFVASLAITSGTLLFVGLWSRHSFPSPEELQARYPLESMAYRLAYEDARTPPGGRRLEEARLAGFEAEVNGKGRWFKAVERTEMLKNVHRTAVQRFIDSPGFGRMRNLGPREPDAAKIDEYGGDYLRDRPPDGGPAERPGDELAPPDSERRPVDAPLLAALGKGHGATVLDFVNVPGFGYVRDRSHVAGFRPHGLHERPKFSRDESPEAKWEVTHLELVSLLKFGFPRVYVLPGSFPRMNRLGDSTTRSLDAFEDRALAALQAGEDLVAESDGGRVRLVGSVRAVKQCLACHDVSRGDLLGAFTYQLRKAGSAP
jgi:hypothetical protein